MKESLEIDGCSPAAAKHVVSCFPPSLTDENEATQHRFPSHGLVKITNRCCDGPLGIRSVAFFTTMNATVLTPQGYMQLSLSHHLIFEAGRIGLPKCGKNVTISNRM